MWNYRVVVENKGTEEEWWSIREVFYNDGGEICGMTEDAMSPMGVDIDELKTDLSHMFTALKKDIIILDDSFVFAPWDFDITKGE